MQALEEDGTGKLLGTGRHVSSSTMSTGFIHLVLVLVQTRAPCIYGGLSKAQLISRGSESGSQPMRAR